MRISTMALVLSVAVLQIGCTVALNQDKWNSWIGSNWRDYNATNGSGNCSISGSVVTCPQALGDLHFYVDSEGTIQTWDYIHRD